MQHPTRSSRERPAGARRAITVRRAESRDLATVVELRLALLREHEDDRIYGRLRHDAPERARRLFAAQLSSPNEVIFLAEQDGLAVGILRCVQVAGLPLLFPAFHGYITSVYVVPAARRRGVMRSMLEAAVQWCRERGIDELRLHNIAESEAANAAWEALGFRVAEHLRVRHLH